MESYIRFDWAMKRLLRNKANYAVLEGLLTTLLEEKVTIHKLLESESNQEDEFDKYNRVDMLAENSKGELVLIEVQNNIGSEGIGELTFSWVDGIQFRLRIVENYQNHVGSNTFQFPFELKFIALSA